MKKYRLISNLQENSDVKKENPSLLLYVNTSKREFPQIIE
jgi:hypothetical protein